ncbi:active regulator of SIRT1-like [Wyeomyia smithii]|uniref:active regulator of SIRT1-like n=1 Tax=Wyeomyia smithii TaxID=174621 RepID=UPI002467D867|nr:active regulator of SIRT1-like [Wyeomyia smithii]
MSKSLVRKALALAEEGLECSSNKKTTKQSTAVKDTSDLMPQHHKSVRHVGKKGSKVPKDVLKKRIGKLTVVEARKQLQNRTDNTDDNIRKLLLLSSANIGRQGNAKLVKRAQTGRYVVKAKEIVPKQKAEKSVFSEEDFRKFEEELQQLG